jgi:hypothetical protein
LTLRRRGWRHRGSTGSRAADRGVIVRHASPAFRGRPPRHDLGRPEITDPAFFGRSLYGTIIPARATGSSPAHPRHFVDPCAFRTASPRQSDFVPSILAIQSTGSRSRHDRSG